MELQTAIDHINHRLQILQHLYFAGNSVSVAEAVDVMGKDPEIIELRRRLENLRERYNQRVSLLSER